MTTCTICKKNIRFWQHQVGDMHLKCYMNEPIKKTEPTTITCPKCPDRKFKKQQHLDMHNKTHANQEAKQ